MGTVKYCNGSTYTQGSGGGNWRGWAFTTTSAEQTLNKIGFRKSTTQPDQRIAVAVARLNASNQIVEVIAQHQWQVADMPTGGTQDVWYTLPSPIYLQPNTKYAVLETAGGMTYLCFITNGKAAGNSIVVDSHNLATVSGYISSSPTLNNTYPLVANSQQCTINTGAPSSTTSGNWGMIIDIGVPPTPKELSGSISATATVEGALTKTAITPKELSGFVSAGATMQGSLAKTVIVHKELSGIMSAAASMQGTLTSGEIENLRKAQVAVTATTPERIKAVAGVLKDGVWYFSEVSDEYETYIVVPPVATYRVRALMVRIPLALPAATYRRRALVPNIPIAIPPVATYRRRALYPEYVNEPSRVEDQRTVALKDNSKRSVEIR